MMCVSRCLYCVGLALIPLAIISILSNVLLLLPELTVRFLLEGHVTREATWATGLWGSGVLVLAAARSFIASSRTRGCCTFRRQMFCQVLYSGVCLGVSGLSGLVSLTGLVRGPRCLYNSSSGPTWGVPLKPRMDGTGAYLHNRSLWSQVCLRPSGVVLWNLVLFSLMGGSCALQLILCGLNVLNTLTGLLLGPGAARREQEAARSSRK
ncbi:transmembrane 4 L6 family member 5 [Synchiropus picturatus]